MMTLAKPDDRIWHFSEVPPAASEGRLRFPKRTLAGAFMSSHPLAWPIIDRTAGHDLRHEAASRLFERGLNVAEVAAVLGHADYLMLARYVHPRAEDIARKLE